MLEIACITKDLWHLTSTEWEMKAGGIAIHLQMLHTKGGGRVCMSLGNMIDLVLSVSQVAEYDYGLLRIHLNAQRHGSGATYTDWK